MDPRRILVVDDEESMVTIVGHALEEAGYSVAKAPDAETARDLLDEFDPELIVLDVMLPGESGLELCRDVRARSAIPIIMLSARTEEVDRILGLEFGADDYVVKPFSARELVSRVGAQLRRSDMAPARHGNEIRLGDLRVDPDGHQVTMRGEPVHLTTSEFQLLLLLGHHPGKVFSRRAILNVLSGGGIEGEERSVDVHVHNIREKIEPDPANPEYLMTVRGTGYRLRES